ncbi:hypothetical protein L915_09779 [Phytophthora nicotianae]|uniref:Uncharacterized protein n=1 Tax=Phytophthora nicotianae TaxID=4792 RepID=W2IXK1_PHYNI|nr:hypothetical protein L915_09779 [Phytophthora nicotianae]ETL38846.1 hypothetical protein L916_09686 [Phytophthora nicotianae]
MPAIESPLVTSFEQSLTTPKRLERLRDHSVSVVSSTDHDHDEKTSVQWRPSNLGTLMEDPVRQLTVMGIVGLCYFSVCGGPIGSEPIISAGGPLIGLILLLVFPVILGLPIAYVTAELSTAYPEDGKSRITVLG